MFKVISHILNELLFIHKDYRSIQICKNVTYDKAWNLLNALGINKEVCYISWQDTNNVKIEKWSLQVIFSE